VDADTAEQVEANWHALKAEEKGRSSVTDGIPEQLPALLRASKVQARSATLVDRLPELPSQDQAERIVESVVSEDEFGDLLLALVSIARVRGWDGEGALRQAVRRRVDEIRRIEQGS
jgi:XTP/dITP diphosphohydrolase